MVTCGSIAKEAKEGLEFSWRLAKQALSEVSNAPL